MRWPHSWRSTWTNLAAVFSDHPGPRWVNEAGARVFARLPDLRLRVEEQARALQVALERPLDSAPPTTFDVCVGPRERAIGDLHVVRDSAGRPLVFCHFTVLVDEDAESTAERPRLTPTERVVLVRMTRGLANKEIAVDLGVSPETVRTHVKSIFRKLGVDTRVKAAMWGREHLASLADP
jgi:DNA-binding CsgD family transcriptional regulator